MSKKTVECNVIVMDTSAEGVTVLMRRETSKEDVSMSQVTNEDSNNTHNANLSEFQYLFGLNCV